MNDRIVRAYLPGSKIQIIFASSTELARHGRDLQKAYPTAAGLFAQTLTAGLLLGSLQKGDSRLNLQIECDGPVRGLFADARPSGEVRGYIRNGQVDFPHEAGPFRAHGALGRKGFISVLRDVNGEVFRGSVDLEPNPRGDCEISDLVERYFRQSEQVETGIALTVRPEGAEPLGAVAGLLVQALPDGDKELLRSVNEALRQGFLDQAPLEAGPLLAALEPIFGEKPQVIDEHPAAYKCTCSKERALRALTMMDREEIVDIWEKEGKAEATCEFCGAHYVIPGEELLGLVFPGNLQKN